MALKGPEKRAKLGANRQNTLDSPQIEWGSVVFDYNVQSAYGTCCM